MRHLWTFLAAACLAAAGSAEAARVGGLDEGQRPGGRSAQRAGCDTVGACLPPEAPNAFPGGVAWDGTHVWVGHYFGGARVYKIDPVTCSVVRSIPAPDVHIGGLAWDGSALWVVPEQSGRIYRINPVDGDILSVIPAPSFGEGDPNAADIAWDGRALWHADYGHGRIYKLDPADGSVLLSYPAPGAIPSGVEFSNGTLLVASVIDHLIYFLDAPTGTVLSTCPAPDGHPWGLALGSHLWNADGRTGLLHLIENKLATAATASTWGRLKIRYR